MQKFDLGNTEKYKIKAFHNSKIYTKKVASQLPGLYYLISQKDNSKSKNK